MKDLAHQIVDDFVESGKERQVIDRDYFSELEAEDELSEGFLAKLKDVCIHMHPQKTWAVDIVAEELVLVKPKINIDQLSDFAEKLITDFIDSGEKGEKISPFTHGKAIAPYLYKIYSLCDEISREKEYPVTVIKYQEGSFFITERGTPWEEIKKRKRNRT